MRASKLISSLALATAMVTGMAALLSGSANATSITESFPNTYMVTYTLTGIGLTDGGSPEWDHHDGRLPWRQQRHFQLGSDDLRVGTQPGETYSSAISFNSESLTSFTQPTGFDFFALKAYNFELELAFTGNLITGAGVSLIGGLGGLSWECFDSFACTTTSQTGDASDFQVRYVGAAVGNDLIATTRSLRPGRC